MNFADAIAITSAATPAALDRARLVRSLDAADEAHREAVSGQVAVSRYSAELDADVSDLQAIAALLVEAGEQVAFRLRELAKNNLSVPDGAAKVSAKDIAERLEEALDGLLTPTAARFVGAAVSVELG